MPTCDWYWWYYCSTTIITTCRTNKQFDKIIRFETKDFSRFRGLLSVSFFQKILSSNPFLFFSNFQVLGKGQKNLGSFAPSWEPASFVAACVSIHGLPFCGFRITKAPIGPWGKAAIVPELGIQLFVDDRPDIVNEVKRTGIFTHLATGRSTSWTNDLLRFFQQEDRGRAQNLVATPLRKDQFSKEPPGRRGYWLRTYWIWQPQYNHNINNRFASLDHHCRFDLELVCTSCIHSSSLHSLCLGCLSLLAPEFIPFVKPAIWSAVFGCCLLAHV